MMGYTTASRWSKNLRHWQVFGGGGSGGGDSGGGHSGGGGGSGGGGHMVENTYRKWVKKRRMVRMNCIIRQCEKGNWKENNDNERRIREDL